MRVSPVRVLLSVVFAVAAFAGVGSARTKPEPCADGRFLQATPIIGSSATGAFDAVVLDAGTLEIESGCTPGAVTLKASKKRTRVHATWATCGSLTNVRLTGTIGVQDGEACSRFKAVVKAKKHKPIKVDATRSRCGDARTDTGGGESCDPPASGSCSDTCQSTSGAIVAPERQWTWVPVDGAVCANGTPTGIGINPGTSGRVVIYMMGGGACWDNLTCYVIRSAANIESGYDAAAFAAEAPGLLNQGFFNRNDPDNPFKDDSMVYVPYCTGDVHGGSNPDQVYDGHPTRHVGLINMAKYLARLVPTFPNATRVILSGSSAGGFGALTNWWQAQQAFGAIRVDLIDDSGPALPAPYLAPSISTVWSTAWNLSAAVPAGCTDCATDLDKVYGFYADQFPGHRAALLSYTQDGIISGFFQITGQEFQTGLGVLASDILAHDIYRVFFKSGTSHVLFGPATEENGVTLREFVTKMVNDDPTWSSVMPPP